MTSSEGLSFQVLNNADDSKITDKSYYPSSITVYDGARVTAAGLPTSSAHPVTIVKTASASPKVSTAHSVYTAKPTTIVQHSDGHTTAIVGGVLGALLALSLIAIATLAFLLIQAKRRLTDQVANGPQEKTTYAKEAMPYGPAPVEAPGDYTYNRMETDGERGPG